MSFYLAVDAGGTKTEFLLADETRELARVRTGTIKRMRTDDSTATRHLERALAQLEQRTGIAPVQVCSTCIGAAGASVPLVAEWMEAAFARRVGGTLTLVGDVEIALDAAFRGAPGVVAIAGTGSNVAGRDVHGSVTTLGGWGPALADQASGHRVGHQGLRSLFLATDEQRPTSVLQPILARWELKDIGALVEYANRVPAPDFSELAPVIVACAEGGDAVARDVLRVEAEEMAHLVSLMIARLRSSSTDPDWLPEIAFAGSMLEHVPFIRESIIAALRSGLPRLSARAEIVDPLLGALWLARSSGPA